MKPTDKSPKNQPAQVARPSVSRAKAADKIPGTVPVRFGSILFNIVGVVVSAIFLTAFFQHHDPDPANPSETHLNSGYDWMLNTMLAGNLKTIEENPEKTTRQRYEMKWGGGEISYTFKIKDQTPDTAIILMPPRKILTGPNVQFKSIVEIPWITYFLYPRRVVYDDEKDSSALYSKATYLVSVNGWGLDKVGHSVDKPEAFMVLPITK